jgi:hypothetical protein
MQTNSLLARLASVCSLINESITMGRYRITQIEDYEALIDRDAVERIRDKAAILKGLRVVNLNSTYYGGGVAETISSASCKTVFV